MIVYHGAPEVLLLVLLRFLSRASVRIAGVLSTGTLAKAGDTVLGGTKVGIRAGHIPKPFERDNLYTGERELFDPNQVSAPV